MTRPATAAVAAAPEDRLLELMAAREARVAVIGMGYVGLPLAHTFWTAGFPLLGFDVDPAKVRQLNDGRSYLRTLPDELVARMVGSNRFEATDDFGRLDEADVVLICVPTPLTIHREPDLTFVEKAAHQVADCLAPGRLVVLESTTYPGTTDELVRPILEATGLAAGRDFLLAYSPEREDPGNPEFTTARIPKIVGADDPASRHAVEALYGAALDAVVPVPDTRTAEAVKLTENIFRAVNIALVNELKRAFTAMGIDVWSVIDAAKTKPFGFMPFYPGPGLGGHCIPIDPFYLSWYARKYEVPMRFIELAGEINTGMPRYVIFRLMEALNARVGKPVNGASILVVGVAYKKNVDDTRESPAFKLMARLRGAGARVAYHDPHVPVIPELRDHPEFHGEASVALTPETLASYDAVLICTDHDAVDYDLVAAHARLIVDTRNAMAARGADTTNVVKA